MSTSDTNVNPAGTKNGAAEAVRSEVGSQTKAVAGEVSQQAKATVDEAREQARRLADQTRTELLGQADGKAEQAATGLRTIADQLGAIAEGRTTDAGPLADYARQAAGRVGDVAERLRTGGAQGAVDDLTRFARRRPGMFLVGAAGAGFVLGRLVRSGKAAMDHRDDTPAMPGTPNRDATDFDSSSPAAVPLDAAPAVEALP